MSAALQLGRPVRAIALPRVYWPGGRSPARSRPGLGDLTFQQQVQTGASIAQSGAAATSALLVQFGAVGGPMGAAIGAIAAGLIQVGALIAQQFQGCGQTCVIASQDADQVASYLDQNLRTWQASPIKYKSLQLAALNNVQTAFNALQQACSNPQLGAAGQRCISERLVRGGTAPWCPKPGNTGCDWWALYYDPIANDTGIVADPSPVASAGASVLSSFGLSPSTKVGPFTLDQLVIPGLLVGAGLLL